VVDPDTGELISDAEVAEITFTAFASTAHPVTARLIVRRVRDQARVEELFPVWRHHPFFTNNDEPTVQADLTHRRHAVIETVFADLIDGPLAHLPSARFASNYAWAICAMITHNLLRATDSLVPHQSAVARGAPCAAESCTSQRGWPDPNDAWYCTFRRTGPGPPGGWRSGTESSTRTSHTRRHTRRQQRPETDHRRAGTTPRNPQWKRWANQRTPHVPSVQTSPSTASAAASGSLHGFRLSTSRFAMPVFVIPCAINRSTSCSRSVSWARLSWGVFLLSSAATT
jgi:hypothetical protein